MSDVNVQWAPPEAKPRKSRVGLWLALGVTALVGGAAAASMTLIAPGTTIAGVPVGGLTPAAAANTVEAQLSSTSITLTGAGGDVVITGADLGAAVDADALAQAAFDAAPMWNITAWASNASGTEIEFDHDKALATLREAVPASFVDAVDATVVFDEGDSTYTTTPAKAGIGINLDDLNAAFTSNVADRQIAFEYPGDPVEAPPAVSDDDAEAMATHLNEMIKTAGFYIGDKREIAISAAQLNEWVTIDVDNGELVLSVDPADLQETVDAIPEAVNKKAVNSLIITNSSGTELSRIDEGKDGRTLNDADTLAAAMANALETGDGQVILEFTKDEYKTEEIVRRIEVNLSTQQIFLFENDEVVDSWAVSTGRAPNYTLTGDYTLGWRTESQNMRGYEKDGNGNRFVAPDGWNGPVDGNGYAMYEQPNVRWAMYFNGDQALHGVYWHSNWGTPMSHGCVGMPEWRAKQIWDWAPEGTEISLYY